MGIDRQKEWNGRSWFKNALTNKDLVARLKQIKLIITDVDGALTDCKIYTQENAEDLKGYSVQDGFGITKAQKAGLIISIVTGKSGKSIEKRATQLGIPKEFYFEGMCSSKLDAVTKVQGLAKVGKNETLLFGDDFLDMQAKDLVSIFAVPANALFYVADFADLVAPLSGGEGAFRLIVDLVLYVQGKHFAQDLMDKVIK